MRESRRSTSRARSRQSEKGKKQADEISKTQRALASYVEGMSRANEKTEELTEREKALSFARFHDAQGQVPQVRELVLGLAEQIEKERSLPRRSSASARPSWGTHDAQAPS